MCRLIADFPEAPNAITRKKGSNCVNLVGSAFWEEQRSTARHAAGCDPDNETQGRTTGNNRREYAGDHRKYSPRATVLKACKLLPLAHHTPSSHLFLLWSSQLTSSPHNTLLIKFKCFVNQCPFIVSDNHNNREEMNNRDSKDEHWGAALQSLSQGNTSS